VAICGLPPLNGFVSEFLVYSGMFRCAVTGSGRSWMLATFAAPALALVGALALACFAKAYGAVFLGTPRSEGVEHAHEAPRAMLIPMGILAGICALIGMAPLAVAPFLDRAIAAWAPGIAVPSVASAAPLGWVGIGSVVLAAGLALAWLALSSRLRSTPSGAGPTWGCGYLAPTSRMQYTASSFAENIVRIFHWALWPVVRRPQIKTLFPPHDHFHSHVPDAVLDRAVLPAVGVVARIFVGLRRMQTGSIPIYVLYILATLLALLAWQLGGPGQ